MSFERERSMVGRKLGSCLLGLWTIALIHSPVNAAIVTLWNEASQGDLATDIGSPTVFSTPLVPNEYRVSGSTINSPLDRDFWRITVAPGNVLSSVILRSYSSPETAGGSFFAVFQGTLTAIPPNTAAGQAQLMGATLVGIAAGRAQGDNVLDDLGLSTVAPNAQKFTPPLPAGTAYTFWSQENAFAQSYTYEFVVTAVPEPSTALLASFGLAALSLSRRRRVND
jgi:hypothetical protein